jgi:hypothetical protein
MSEPTHSPKPLDLDVDLDPDLTQDELSHDAAGEQRERTQQMLEDVPPHH